MNWRGNENARLQMREARNQFVRLMKLVASARCFGARIGARIARRHISIKSIIAPRSDCVGQLVEYQSSPNPKEALVFTLIYAPRPRTCSSLRLLTRFEIAAASRPYVHTHADRSIGATCTSKRLFIRRPLFAIVYRHPTTCRYVYSIS